MATLLAVVGGGQYLLSGPTQTLDIRHSYLMNTNWRATTGLPRSCILFLDEWLAPPRLLRAKKAQHDIVQAAHASLPPSWTLGAGHVNMKVDHPVQVPEHVRREPEGGGVGSWSQSRMDVDRTTSYHDNRHTRDAGIIVRPPLLRALHMG